MRRRRFIRQGQLAHADSSPTGKCVQPPAISGPAEESVPPADLEATRLRRVLARVAARLGLEIEGSALLDDPVPLLEAVDRAVGEARLANSLATGSGLDAAVIASVTELLHRGRWHEARALADALGRLGHREVSLTCLGLAAHRREWHRLAVEQWQDVADDTLLRWVPCELIESLLAHDHPESRDRLRRVIALVGEGTNDALRVDVAARLLAMGLPAEASDLVTAVIDRDSVGSERQEILALIGEAAQARPSDMPTGAVAIGVLDYRQPDHNRASTNVGDYVQTLALLGNIARHANLIITGDDGLGAIARTVQQDVPEPLRVTDTAAAAVHLLPVHRDVSSIQSLPEPTWLPAFGWHMHSMFRLRHDFPYHHHVRPIFVSWHLNRPELLTSEAVEYLRRYGPVGCRDWTTVFVLLSAGVDAFFTGCLTSTVDAAVAPKSAEGARKVLGVVDPLPRVRARLPSAHEELTHTDDELPTASLAAGITAARDTLGLYRNRFRRVVTSRLHSYLPATSLGIPVRFVPKNLADPRFAGLRDMSPESPEFVTMRDRLRSLLSETFAMISGGHGEEDVYQRWRELTAPYVAEARARHAQPASRPGLASDPDEMIATIRREMESYGPLGGLARSCVDVALSCDDNLAEALPVTIESLLSNASAPLRLWIMTRGLSVDYRAWLATTFPDTPITFLPCDHVAYGDVLRMIKHITLSTMDRLLLPDVLTDVDRIVYIDIDALVLGDVAALAATDLHDHPFAARSSYYPGYLWWWKAALKLEPTRADELRRIITHAHPFGYPALNAGILVMDLAAMREDGFTRTYLPYAEHYGLNDQDILMAYAGGNRAALDSGWNAWPVMERIESPHVVHYVGASKPWDVLLTPMDGLWAETAARLQARASWPPPR
jgi:lipopolysaccharide biosynthesis glycosyltransferase